MSPLRWFGCASLAMAVAAVTATAQHVALYLPPALCSQCTALVHEAVASYERGDLRGATWRLQEATRHHPAEATLHFMLGNALYRAGQLHEAANAYERCVELRFNDLEGLVSLGFARYETGDAAAAVSHWQRAVSVNPQEPLARAALAVGLSTTGRTAEAVEEYTMAVALDPRYGKPDKLAIDIRWKPRALGTLKRLLKQSSRAQPPQSG